jgi:hypothetical protein
MNIDFSGYIDYPSRIIEKRPDTHGFCHSCDLYASLYVLKDISLCPDCFKEIGTPIWEKKSKELQEKTKEIRLKDAWKNECEKRHKKGHAPINMRY